jgi:hypothetical protein
MNTVWSVSKALTGHCTVMLYCKSEWLSESRHHVSMSQDLSLLSALAGDLILTLDLSTMEN